jgi:hypothetical protein
MKIGVIATELMVTVAGKRQIPYAKHGIVYAGDAPNQERLVSLRMEGFEAILGEVDFVWALMQRTADEYRNSTRICEFLPFGSIGPLPDETRRSPKDINALFVGKNTPHRTSVLRMLAQKGMNVVAVGQGFQGDWIPPAIVESLLDRAKIGLNLTLHGLEDAETLGVDPRFASCQRIIEMLSRQLCVVSEEIPLDNPYSEFMVSSQAGTLSDLCGEMLANKAWIDVGVSKAARFHETMDVRKICRPVIESTLAALA